jgi:hypothetical protein
MRTFTLLLSAAAFGCAAPTLAQPRIAGRPPPAGDAQSGTAANAILSASIPADARPLTCGVVMAGWVTPTLEITNPGPAKVDAGDTVIYRANPGGQASKVLQDDLGKGESFTGTLPVRVTSSCVAYAAPHGTSGGATMRGGILAADLSDKSKPPLTCTAGRMGGPIADIVMLTNPGAKPLPKGSKVAYVLGGSSEVWHSLLPVDFFPGGQLMVPAHGGSSTCRAWAGE